MAYYKSIPDAEEHIKDLETKPYEVCFLFKRVCSFGTVLLLLLLGEISGILFAYVFSVLNLALFVISVIFVLPS